jgi:hypothetical protein
VRLQVALLAALLAVPALAEDAPSSEPEPFPVQAAAWCVVQDRESSPAPVQEPVEEEPREAVEEPAEPGCDVGVGLALYRWRRLSWVAVLGQETIGTGLAFVPHRPKRGPIPALAVGIVVPYDSEGIYSEPRLAIGATLAFTGRQP